MLRQDVNESCAWSVGWVLPLLVAVCVCGCAPRLAPRTAEIAAPGETVGGIHMQVANVGVGSAQLSREGEVEPVVEESGMLHQALPMPWMAYMYAVSNTGGDLRLGLFEPCELGPMMSWTRLGGELRCGVLSQRAGDGVSMALSSGAAYQPLLGEGVWLRGGVDVSSKVGDWLLMTNLHLSYGRELHSMKLDDVPEDAVESEDDSLMVDILGDLARTGTWARLERDELRLNLALGAGWQVDESMYLTLGVVPHAALQTGKQHRASCVNCSSLELDRLSERFSVDLVAGLMWTPEEAFEYDRGEETTLEIVGAVLWGGSYAMFVGPLAMLAAESESPLGDMAWLLVPVAGPFLWADTLDMPRSERVLLDITTYGMATMQGTGVFYLTMAFLLDDEPTEPSAFVPGVPGSDAVGATARGSF